jgi:hypothetical protein
MLIPMDLSRKGCKAVGLCYNWLRPDTSLRLFRYERERVTSVSIKGGNFSTSVGFITKMNLKEMECKGVMRL